MLNDDSARGSRSRYALETLLAAIGVPHQFVPHPDAAAIGGQDRHAYLIVGQDSPLSIERLARNSAVVLLPSPGVGEDSPLPPGEAGRAERGRVRAGGTLPAEQPSPRPSPRGREGAQHPSPDAQDSALGTQHPALDPKQIRVLEEPSGGGCLIRVAGDLVGSSFALLTRAEEYAGTARDRFDRFRWTDSRLQPPELAARPLVSEYARLLLTCLKEACLQARLPMIRKKAWPLGRPLAACLTHDVDVVRRGKLPRGVAVRDVKEALSSAAHGRWRIATSRMATIARTATADEDPYWSFDQISDLERLHDYRSTYYFMAGRHHSEDAGYDLEGAPMAALLRSLIGSGCEIGLHGSYASYTDLPLLERLKAHLEQQVGRAVTGHRNHLLRFRVPESWRAQEAAGFSYDATLGYHDREGFRGGHAFPFHPYDLEREQTLELQEIPLAIMDIGLLKYRHLREEQAQQAILAVLEQTMAVDGLATLLWHNHTFYDPEFPGCGRLYQRALDWLAESDAYVATAREIDSWWRARSAVRLSPLSGERTGWRIECPREIAGLALEISLPDPQVSLRVRGQLPLTVHRNGPDYLLELGRLAAGFVTDIEYA